MFTSPKQRAEHQAAMAVWSQLAEDEDKEVIYAVVDVDANKKVRNGNRMPKPLFS